MTNGTYSAGRTPRTESTHVCVLHDDNGTILHMHRITTFAGAHARSEQEIEREVRALAAERGHSDPKSHALHARNLELDPTKMYRVDIRSRRLLPSGDVSKLMQHAGTRKL